MRWPIKARRCEPGVNLEDDNDKWWQSDGKQRSFEASLTKSQNPALHHVCPDPVTSLNVFALSMQWLKSVWNLYPTHCKAPPPDWSGASPCRVEARIGRRRSRRGVEIAMAELRLASSWSASTVWQGFDISHSRLVKLNCSIRLCCSIREAYKSHH